MPLQCFLSWCPNLGCQKNAYNTDVSAFRLPQLQHTHCTCYTTCMCYTCCVCYTTCILCMCYTTCICVTHAVCYTTCMCYQHCNVLHNLHGLPTLHVLHNLHKCYIHMLCTAQPACVTTALHNLVSVTHAVYYTTCMCYDCFTQPGECYTCCVVHNLHVLRLLYTTW